MIGGAVIIRRLGYATTDRLLIINADDFGLTRGTNEAIVSLFESNSITSASIMMPCPESNEAIAATHQYGIRSIGIHLTLTSDLLSRYTPIYNQQTLHSLVEADGKFHTDVAILERNADEHEVRMELDAQIQSALLQGIDPTHLDSHAGSIMGLATGRDFLELTFDLCEKYGLPFNLPSRIIEQPFLNTDQLRMFRNRIASARDRKIVLIDDIVSLPYCVHPSPTYDKMKIQLGQMLKNLRPGITQLTIHPSKLTDRLKSITSCYHEREIEHRLLQDQDIQQWIERERIKLISWKDIRDLQRSS